MQFNPNAVQTIDQSTVENEGPRYPTISWISGDPSKKKSDGVEYRGGWFIGEDGASADMTEYGWQKDSIITGSGKEIEGYWSQEINLSLINHRRRWVVDGQGFPWRDYEKAAGHGNPRGHQQFLVLLKGVEELGPFSITLKGHAGMSFQGVKDYNGTGALSCFNRTVIAAANAATKAQKLKWPYRAFWLPVGTNKDEKGIPVFTTVGSPPNTSNIVLPVPLGLPEKSDSVELSEYYIGDDLLAIANQLNDESTDWVAMWDTETSSDNAHEDEEEKEEIEKSAAEELGL